MRNAAAAAALVLAGCGASTSSSARTPAVTAIPVAVATVGSAVFSTPVDLSGSVSAVRSVTVGAVSAGRITSVGVRAGDRVAAGTILARVDTSGYAAGLAQARAGVAGAAQNQLAAGAQLAAARSRFALARTTAGRMSQLFTEGAISRQQRDETQADLDAATAGVHQAEAGLAAAASAVSEARAGADAAQVPLLDATVTAAFGGVVTNTFVEPGAVVGPGSPIASIEDTGDLELDVAVPDDDLAALVPGRSVDVVVGSSSIAGRVRAFVPTENPALRSTLVKIALVSDADIVPGMFARVSIAANAHRGTSVPLSALVTRAGQSGVFVIGHGTASFEPVQAGTVGATTVEVHGVAPGALVAVGSLDRLTDGAAVTVLR
jgi:multidrug efflux pump subunit AcrA (membrane-fusion protein)